MSERVNYDSAKLNKYNFHPLVFVFRYRDRHLQVGENYSHLFNLKHKNCKSLCLNAHFISNINDLIG